MHRYWQVFHENSAVDWKKMLTSDKRYWLRRHLKCYRRFEHFPLQTTTDINSVLLINTINERRTQYSFQPTVSDIALGTLLITCLKEKLECAIVSGEDADFRRPYPSAGALYPVETYVLAPYSLSEQLPAGKYHYCHYTGQLERLDNRIDANSINKAFGQSFSLSNAVTIILTGAVEKSFRKYGERAYRYTLFEAGHIMQLLCLVSTGLGLRCAPLGGFSDRDLANEIYIRTELEVPLYALAIG